MVNIHVIYGSHELDWQRILQLTGENWEILLWNLVLFRYVYPAQTQYDGIVAGFARSF